MKLKSTFLSEGIKMKDAAEKCKISKTAMSNILADREQIGILRAKKFSAAYGFDITFLTTGQGTLFGHHPDKTQTMTTQVNNGTMSQQITTTPADCPDVSELLAKIAELTADRDAARKEVEWMRKLVDRLTNSKEE